MTESKYPRAILWAAIIVAVAAAEAGPFQLGTYTMTVPLGIAIVAHTGLTELYDRRIFFWLHPNRDFRGTWIYKLTNHRTKRVLFGHFRVLQTLHETKIRSGKVWYGDKAIKSDNHRAN